MTRAGSVGREPTKSVEEIKGWRISTEVKVLANRANPGAIPSKACSPNSAGISLSMIHPLSKKAHREPERKKYEWDMKLLKRLRVQLHKQKHQQ